MSTEVQWRKELSHFFNISLLVSSLSLFSRMYKQESVNRHNRWGLGFCLICKNGSSIISFSFLIVIFVAFQRYDFSSNSKCSEQYHCMIALFHILMRGKKNKTLKTIFSLLFLFILFKGWHDWPLKKAFA